VKNSRTSPAVSKHPPDTVGINEEVKRGGRPTRPTPRQPREDVGRDGEDVTRMHHTSNWFRILGTQASFHSQTDYSSFVLSVLLCASVETWTLVVSDVTAIKSFRMKCQRRILGNRWHNLSGIPTNLAPVCDRITRGRNATFIIIII